MIRPRDDDEADSRVVRACDMLHSDMHCSCGVCLRRRLLRLSLSQENLIHSFLRKGVLLEPADRT